MKILILGKNGMLGHVVYNYFLEQGHEVLGTVLNGEGIVYDAFKNQKLLEDIIKTYNPNIVINCIGILNQEAENNHELAIKVNSLLPNYIDSLSNIYNFKFIHISTDCVFDGIEGKYDEKSETNANSYYGKSKSLGEINNEKNITLRTSIIGPDNNPRGIGLFQWFMNQHERIEGYSKVIWTGVTTVELAKVIEIAIKNNLHGLQHVVNNDFISKYKLLLLFKKIFEKDIEIVNNDQISSEKTLIRTDKSYNFEIPSYEQMIIEMKEWILNHQSFYTNLINEMQIGGKKYESYDDNRH